jgi:hypothetical protein
MKLQALRLPQNFGRKKISTVANALDPWGSGVWRSKDRHLPVDINYHDCSQYQGKVVIGPKVWPIEDGMRYQRSLDAL